MIRDHTLNNLLNGAAAGFVATVPMTIAMKLLKRQLPPHLRYPLPPRLIASNAARKARVAHKLPERAHRAMTAAAHFGYGTAAGALFGPMSPRDVAPAAAAGVGYGLFVWAGSYLGLLPSLNLLPPATKHPPQRVALMIAAHAVWGAALGATSALFLRRRTGGQARSYDAKFREAPVSRVSDPRAARPLPARVGNP
jgi:hypothetical protein